MAVSPETPVGDQFRAQGYDGRAAQFPDQEGADKPLISFVRYDARMEKNWLANHCAELDSELTPEYIEGLQQLDRPDLMASMYKVGEICARAQVTPDDFPNAFDPA